MSIWPSHSKVVSTIPTNSIDAEDHVLTVFKHIKTKSAIVLRLKKQNGLEYGVAIQMPLRLVRKAALVIKVGMSLREIGGLDI
jgi:hypothetical protein